MSDRFVSIQNLCLILLVIMNYCPVSPPGEPTYYTGSTNQTIDTYSTMGCALGYQAASDGYPVYYCGSDTATNGVYSLISGDCLRTLRFTILQYKIQ